MKTEEQKVSGAQLTQLMICYIMGSNILLAVSISIAKKDVWVAILAGLCESLVFAVIYILISNKFPNKTLIEINDIIFGRFLGKLVSVLYVIFFFLLGSSYLRIMANFFGNQIIPETPIVILSSTFLIVCAYAVKKGFEVISRMSMILLILVIFEVILFFIFGFKSMKFGNFLPIMDISIADFIKSSNIIGATNFGEIVVFLMFFAFLNQSSKVKGSFIFSLLSGGAILIIISVTTIALIGNLAPIDNYPYHQSVRIINIRDIITRFEIISACNVLFMLFFKICVLYYATILGIEKIFKLSSHDSLVLPIGILMINLSLILYKNSVEVSEFAKNIFPFYSWVFEVFFPVLILIIGNFKTTKKFT